jgi:hypothetical protein
MCETTEIRFVQHMEDDYVGALAREKTMRNAGGRRQRWLTRNWRTSSKGNPFINTDGYNIVVYPAGQDWGFRITNRESGRTFATRLRLPSPEAAKLRAFDAMVLVKQRESGQNGS